MGSLDESWFRPEAFLNHYKSTWKSTILSNCVHSSQHKHTEEKLKSKTHENAHPNERFFFKVQSPKLLFCLIIPKCALGEESKVSICRSIYAQTNMYLDKQAFLLANVFCLTSTNMLLVEKLVVLVFFYTSPFEIHYLKKILLYPYITLIDFS